MVVVVVRGDRLRGGGGGGEVAAEEGEDGKGVEGSPEQHGHGGRRRRRVGCRGFWGEEGGMVGGLGGGEWGVVCGGRGGEWAVGLRGFGFGGLRLFGPKNISWAGSENGSSSA